MKQETFNVLRSRKQIQHLFSSGLGVTVFPFRILYCVLSSENETKMEVLFSVPKKMLKKAVKRNLIRRRAKESFRLNKHLFIEQIPENQKLLVTFIYIDKTIHPYETIKKGVINGFTKIIEKICQQSSELSAKD
ncbi:MAG: ribonuclease P protein component [Marinilabiliaceae bacterium]|nr:ribonuclease P protein component [Marinilabiliaceae bacterium]